MDDNVAISVNKLHKDFVLPHDSVNSLKDVILHPGKKRTSETQHVLHGISFEVKKGEFFGVVGRNGSGKSTLLKILAGTYQPSAGEASVKGSLVPFIELGVGFNPELSGRDNVYLNGALLGFSRKEMSKMYDDIVEFAELERFMDQKVKNYSSGMQVRLAFSIAIKVETDVLLVDEVLAVGDANFQRKCYKYFEQLKKSGKTVVFISHDMEAVIRFCDRAVMIKNGEIVKAGTPKMVAEEYFKENFENAKKSKVTSKKLDDDGSLQIVATEINGKKDFAGVKNSEPVKVSVALKAKTDLEAGLVAGLVFSRDASEPVFWTNTQWQEVELGPIKKGAKISLAAEVQNVFPDGSYTIDVAFRNKQNSVTHLKQQALLSFDVTRNAKNGHLIHPEAELKVSVS